MKILTVCNRGRRAEYLANYLKEKGHETTFGGTVEGEEHDITQTEIDWADKVIAAAPPIADRIKDRFEISEEKLITLTPPEEGIQELSDLNPLIEKHLPELK